MLEYLHSARVKIKKDQIHASKFKNTIKLFVVLTFKKSYIVLQLTLSIQQTYSHCLKHSAMFVHNVHVKQMVQ